MLTDNKKGISCFSVKDFFFECSTEKGFPILQVRTNKKINYSRKMLTFPSGSKNLSWSHIFKLVSAWNMKYCVAVY